MRWLNWFSIIVNILDSFSWISWNLAIGFPNCFLSRQYFNAASYAPAAIPVAPHPICNLDVCRTFLVPVAKSLAFASLSQSGTKTSFRVMSPFWSARNEYLFLI